MTAKVPFQHVTVLADELVDGLALEAGDTAIDCTAGGGGHTAKLLAKVGASGKVLAIDCDNLAVATLHDRFSKEIASANLQIVQARFSEIKGICKDRGITEVAGICADLGVSSPQLDQEERGFSFAKDGPLDMRMNPGDGSESAADLLRTVSQEDLERILADFGEEPKARPLARAIIRAREQAPITTTAQLAEIVKSNVHYRTVSRVHPATRTFMALRISVNHELAELEALLAQSFQLLKGGGRLGIISFHSLEDRLVKQSFRRWAGKGDNQEKLHGLPFATVDEPPVLGQIIKPFPQEASAAETAANPRARSAKLRVIEKLNQ